MFCHNCGIALDEGAKFCPNCGMPVTEPAQEPIVEAEPVYEQPEAPVYQQPEAPVYQQPEAPVYNEPVVTSAPVVNEALNGLAKSCLIFGILGVAFCCMPYLISILGIIFSGIGKGKVKQFQEAGGVLSGKAKVGNILSKVGMIVSIIMTVIWAIVVVALIIAAFTGRGSYYRY